LAKLKPKLKLFCCRQELLDSKEVQDVLCHPEFGSVLKQLDDLLATSLYIKVKKRTIMAIFVRLARCLLLSGEHNLRAQSSEIVKHLYLTTTELADIVREDREPIRFFLQLLSKLQQDCADLAKLTNSMATLALDESDLSASDIDDLDKSVRFFPECARCKAASSFPCPRCQSIAYCGLVCQTFDWVTGHFKNCKVKNE